LGIDAPSDTVSLIGSIEYAHWLIAQRIRSPPSSDERREPLVGKAYQALHATIDYGTHQPIPRGHVDTLALQIPCYRSTLGDRRLRFLIESEIEAHADDNMTGTARFGAQLNENAAELDKWCRIRRRTRDKIIRPLEREIFSAECEQRLTHTSTDHERERR